jgi:hypothetical protein
MHSLFHQNNFKILLQFHMSELDIQKLIKIVLEEFEYFDKCIFFFVELIVTHFYFV